MRQRNVPSSRPPSKTPAEQAPLFLEPLAFGVITVPDTRCNSGNIDLNADVMKVAWPGAEHLDAMAELLEGRTWVMLSGGGDFDAYLSQVEAALAVGCAGFMAGPYGEKPQVAADSESTCCVGSLDHVSNDSGTPRRLAPPGEAELVSPPDAG